MELVHCAGIFGIHLNAYCKSIGFRLVFVSLLIFPISLVRSQTYNLGIPPINNFSPSSYNGGTQNWRMDMSPDGVLYVANNDGMMVFDGNEWQVYPLPNLTIARSIDFHNDTVYVGGQDELGYFIKDNKGEYYYQSLWNTIPAAQQDIADIWDLIYFEGKLYFRNYMNLFSIENGIFKTEKDQTYSFFLSRDEDFLHFDISGKGVFQINRNGMTTVVPATQSIAEFEIINKLSFDYGSLLFTADNGIFLLSKEGNLSEWKTNARSYLKNNEITASILMSNGNIAVGTRLGGLVIIDKNGNTLYIFNNSNGLQSNSITCILEDKWTNLWVGTYFGIDRINFGSGFNTFYPDGELEGAVYDVKLWNDRLYFATSNGLYNIPYQTYASPFGDNSPAMVEFSKGQVWNMDKVDEKLFIGHHNGSFEVIQDQLINNLNVNEGIWRFVKIDSEHLAVGCYNGIYLFSKNHNNWKLEYKLQDFYESSRIMEVDRYKNLWVSHPYRGIFKINFKNNFESHDIASYGLEEGLECEYGNYIFHINNKILATNPCGIFSYQNDEDRFVQDTSFQIVLGDQPNVYRLFDKPEGIWFIAKNETGIIHRSRQDSQGYYTDKTNIPHLGKAYVGGFENLFPLDSSKIFLCSNRGVRIYSSVKHVSTPSIQAILEYCEINSSNTLGPDQLINTELKPNQRNLTFYFRTNGLIAQDFKGYQYKLVGYDEEWHETSLHTKEYNNLPSGEYSFDIRVIDNIGNPSEITNINFEIKEKWFNTSLAKLISLSLLLISFLLIFLIPRKKYKKETIELVNIQKKTEKELLQVKEEKLQDEIKYKTNELANVTLHLIQKKQTIDALKGEINKLKKTATDSSIRKDIKGLTSLLKDDERLEEDWEKFTLLFDQVHIDFMRRLKAVYPQLTPKDQKLCAFLRMNLTTKEIAPLLSISVRGVEISRYRLRKKLDLERDVNLSEFMINF